MRVALISTYELGHQPLGVATAASALTDAGHEVRCSDTSINPLTDDLIAWADAFAISVPMHTAMRLGIDAARHLRSLRPDTPICLFGLYAAVGSDHLMGDVIDHRIVGEFESALVEWVDGPMSHPDRPTRVEIGRHRSRKPDRSSLPQLDVYARLEIGDESRLVGYVEASRGCRHRCRHCPVPVVYDGRVRVIDPEIVAADVAALVELGAGHVTFGDPDFFNAVPHAMKVVELVHARFPELTFDCTIKVEHVLRHRETIPRLAETGCLFVVTALESTSELILSKLDKGHTVDEAEQAIEILRDSGIEMRPTFLPFTPWTTMTDLVDLCHFIQRHDLVANVDPIQMTIRLLIPEGSLLLDDPTLLTSVGEFDPDRLAHPWASADSDLDRLQSALSLVAEKSVADELTDSMTFSAMWSLIHEAAGLPATPPDLVAGSIVGRPRLTEPWFC